MFGLLFLIAAGGFATRLLLTAMRMSGYRFRFGPFRSGSIIPRRKTVSAPRRVARACKDFHAWEIGDPIRPHPRKPRDYGRRAFEAQKNTARHLAKHHACKDASHAFLGLSADGEILLDLGEREKAYDPSDYTFKNLSS